MAEGHSAEAVQKFVGYAPRRWAWVLYQALVILTGGLLWILGQCVPCVKLWTLQTCSLSKARYVHAMFITGRKELVRVQEIPFPKGTYADECQSDNDSLPAPTMHVICLLLVVYVHDAAEDTFKKLSDLPPDFPTRLHNALKALQQIEQGAEWSVLNQPVLSRQRMETVRLYGTNDMSVLRPNFIKMTAGILAYPPFIVQYFELAFLYYAGYYIVAACLLLMTLASGYFSTYELHKKRSELFLTVGQRRLIPIVMGGRVRAVSSQRLVPGDVIVVLPGSATCDMVLLQGNCLVEESNLSGEAAQVRKSSFTAHNHVHKRAYHPESHHFCTVYAGTTVQQAWADGTSDDEVLAMVVRTGLRSTMGNMLRQVVAPLHQLSLARDPFLSDMFRFFGFALVLQLCIFLIAAVPAVLGRQQPVQEAFKTLIATIIAAVPVAAPTVILAANGACMQRLRQQQIDVLNPAKLKTIADVRVVCFDKTGTLTGSVPELHGMLPVEHGKFAPLQQMAMRWPRRLKQAVAVCNSLTLTTRSQVVGDLADKQAFKAVEARFLERNTVVLPLAKQPGTASSLATLHILKRFEFDASLMRSGVVVADKTARGDPLLVVRGAPSRIQALVTSGMLPPDFNQILLDLAGQSFRMLALAAGALTHVNAERLASMDQQEAEAHCSHMELLALLVLSNHAHPSSQDTITDLHERAGLRTMMVTGDFQHTAIAVARGVGMIPMEGEVVVIQAKSEELALQSLASLPALQLPYSPRALAAQPLPWSPRGGGSCQGLSFMLDCGGACEQLDPQEAMTRLAQGAAQCCMTGPAFEHMLGQEDTSVVETIMGSVAVFARMRSQQKGQVVDMLGRRGLYQNLDAQLRHMPGLGLTCMYCGDGINDLVALASADVGIAVGSGHASAAASVSDRHASVAGVVTVLREARATQAIKLAAIKVRVVVQYMVVYELLMSIAANVLLTCSGTRFLVIQRSTLDVIAIALGIAVTLRPAAAVLTVARPPQALNRRESYAKVFAGVLVLSVMYGCIITFLKQQAWYSGSVSSPQSAAASVLWVAVLNAAVLPLMSFANDTWLFCQKSSRPEVLVYLIYTPFGVLCSILGPCWFDALDKFHFYKLPLAFTWRVYALQIAFLLLYLVALYSINCIRKWYQQHHQNAVVPFAP